MRDRGLFTQRERNYLLGETDIEPKSRNERSIRQSIRDHLKNGIKDFVIAFQGLEARDRKMVFNDLDALRRVRDQQTGKEFGESHWDIEEELAGKRESGKKLDQGSRRAVALLYLAYTDVWGVRTGHNHFEEVIMDGVKQAIEYEGSSGQDDQAARDRGPDSLVRVNVDIDITRLDTSLRDAIESFERGDKLDSEVLRQLMIGGHIDLSAYTTLQPTEDEDIENEERE